MTEKRSNPLWDLLSSVRLTIILLVLLAIASIFGTIIPQQEGAVRFIQELSPGLVRLLDSLQVFDLYHSIWFRLLTCCLALNLIICSINRLPLTLRLFRKRPRIDRSKIFEDLPAGRSITVKGELKEVAARVGERVEGQFGSIQRKDMERTSFIYGERGRYSLFGVYLVHLSFLLILMGAIIGSLFGFNGYVNILDGESVDSVVLGKGGNHRHKDLGFSVFCERSSVDFYDNGTPREYRSEISFILDGKEVHKGSLLVNHPLKFKGITFYLSSYGSIPGGKVRLGIKRETGHPQDSMLELELGEPVTLPGGEGQIILSDARADFMRMGPAVSVLIRPVDGEEIRFWLFKDHDLIMKRFPELFERFPKLNPSAYRPYTFRLDHIESRNYTGLHVNRDPGVPLVYAGFIFIMIGLFITFFTSHRRVWVRVEQDLKVIRIRVAGKVNKNAAGMERDIGRLIGRLREQLNQERAL